MGNAPYQDSVIRYMHYQNDGVYYQKKKKADSQSNMEY